MLSDKKFGLTANLLATKVMPTLIPHTAAPGMTLDQVCAHALPPRSLVFIARVRRTVTAFLSLALHLEGILTKISEDKKG